MIIRFNIKPTLLAVLLSIAASAQAVELIRTADFVLDEGQSLNSDTWILADQIRLAGQAEDDVFLLAISGSKFSLSDEHSGSVSLAGLLQGDVWALANNVNLESKVLGHLRVLADRITISGSAEKTVTLLGNSVEIVEGARLASGGLILANTFVSKGSVVGKLSVQARSITLGGVFEGDLRIEAPDIVILPGTTINGKLSYVSEKELLPNDKVSIAGGLERLTKPALSKPVFGWQPLVFQCWLLCGSLIAGLLFVGLFPSFAERASAGVRQSFWRSALLGAVAFLVFPFIIFFLMVSIIGVMPALLLLLLYLLLIYLSKIVAALTVGTLLLRRPWRGSFWQLLLSLLVGLLFIYLITGTGALGLLAWCIVTFTGMGAMLRTMFFRKIPVADSKARR